MGLEDDWGFQLRAAPLEDVQFEASGAAGQEPQAGGRGVAAGIHPAESEQQSLVLLHGHVEPPQFGASRARKPRQHGGDLSATQGLFGGPQLRCGTVGMNAQQTLARQAPGFQRRPEGLERWIHQDHRPGGLPQPRHQRGQQQLPDMLACPFLEHLHQTAAGPAVAGKAGVQRCVPGRNGFFGGQPLRHPPDMWQDRNFRTAGASEGHGENCWRKSCLFIQYFAARQSAFGKPSP